MRSHVHRIKVRFSDCDPAGIVFFANYFRMCDESFHELLEAAGLAMATLPGRFNSVGFPLLEAGAKFHNSASQGQVLEITTAILERKRKTIRVSHVFRRGEVPILEAHETRVWASPHPEDAGRVKAMIMPPEVCAALDG